MIPVLGETTYGRVDDHALGGLALARLLSSEFSLRYAVSVFLNHKDDVFESIVILVALKYMFYSIHYTLH